MIYDSVSIHRVKVGHRQVRYTGTQGPIPGMRGNWTTSGVLADVHSVSGYLVVSHGLSSKPIHVVADMEGLIEWIHATTGLRP